MLLNLKAFVYLLSFCGLYRLRRAAAEGYECYLITCDGEGCLYPIILQAGSHIPTCTTAENEVCHVSRQNILGGGIEMAATCGPDCDAEPTTTEKLGIFKRRKRSVPEFECCYSDRCNHGSPCGSLTCSAGVPVVARPVYVAVLLTCISVALLQ